jgi:putative oxidoreductase
MILKMMKLKIDVVEICAGVLALLFFYAATSKLMNYERSKVEMFKQIFPRNIAEVLVWAVPVTELLIMLGLLFNVSRLKALYASALLLTAFTLYIAITMSGVFGRIPCSCGGILKHMSYWVHLGFNLIFIVLAVLGIALEKQWKPMNRWLHFFKRKGVPGLH